MEILQRTDAEVELRWIGEIAHVVVDLPGKSVNTLGEAALDAFERLVDELGKQGRLEGMILSSGKRDSFIVGADVDMLESLGSADEATRLSGRAQQALNRLRALEVPTVAAIHGSAMGAGLELALAFRYRVATDHPSTRLALPEVKLGLCPGAGGTQFLPRLVGLQRSLPMLVAGRTAFPRHAARIGLVDAVCAPPLLLQTATGLLRTRSSEGTSPSLPLAHRAVQQTPLLRRIVWREATRRARSETHGHYPAPLRIIEVVREGLDHGIDRGLALEAEAFGELLFTPVSRALVSLFVAGRSIGATNGAPGEREVRTIGILGAGMMGSAIAHLSATNGYDVVVKDQDLSLASQGVRVAMRHADRAVTKGASSRFEAEQRVTRVVPTADYRTLKHADLVIEAVTEDVGLKHRVLQEVEDVVQAHCVLASNTSSIPIEMLATPLTRPERLIGMHYFAPAHRIPLLEIIRTPDTPGDVLSTAIAVGKRQGKTIIVVNDSPGFYTTRVLALYLNEALRLVQEGARIDAIDEAIRAFGFPMGPFEVFDLVGLDTAEKITASLRAFFGQRDVPITDLTAAMVDSGPTQPETPRRFYREERRLLGRGKPRQIARDEEVRARAGLDHPVDIPSSVIVERLVLLFVNEAVRCLEESVLSRPRDGDLGAVMGLGFPPYTGGPFRYADRESAQAVVLRLERLKLAHGRQYEPADLLREMAGRGETFYDSVPDQQRTHSVTN